MGAFPLHKLEAKLVDEEVEQVTESEGEERVKKDFESDIVVIESEREAYVLSQESELPSRSVQGKPPTIPDSKHELSLITVLERAKTS